MEDIRNEEIEQENKPEVNEAENNVDKNKQHDEKTFTQEEVNKIIADRLAREKEKAEKKQEEAKKLAKMNAEEKAKYELEKRESEIAKREAELNVRELTAEAKDILVDKGLPTDLHTLINYENADTVKESIDVIEKSIQKAVELAVSERLKGNAPKKATPPVEHSGWDKINNKYK